MCTLFRDPLEVLVSLSHKESYRNVMRNVICGICFKIAQEARKWLSVAEEGPPIVSGLGDWVFIVLSISAGMSSLTLPLTSPHSLVINPMFLLESVKRMRGS